MTPPSLCLAVAALTLLSVAAPLHAQRAVPAAIDRGSIIIDGSASISRSSARTEGSSSDSKATSTQISLMPSLLYFVAPRFAVGGTIELSRYSSTGSNTTVMGAGPAARLYFAGESANVLPYLGASARVARTSLDIDGTSAPPASTQWGLEGVAGLTWLFSRQVGIVTEAFARRLTYESGLTNNRVDVISTEFGVRLGIAAFVPRGR